MTRKLRLVIPPLSAVSAAPAPASSGTRCIAPTSWSRSSPRRTRLGHRVPASMEERRGDRSPRRIASSPERFVSADVASPVAGSDLDLGPRDPLGRWSSRWTPIEQHESARAPRRTGIAGSPSRSVPPELRNVLMNGL